MRYSKFGYYGRTAAGLAVCAIGAAITIILPPVGPSPFKAVIVSIAAVLGTAIILSAYRNADEVIMQTHKTAWFWGSMVAMALVTPLLVAILWRYIDLKAVLPMFGPGAYFAAGAMAMLLLQCAGFAVFWAYHNLGRRG